MKSHSAFSLWSGPRTASAVEVFPPGYYFTLPPDCPVDDSIRLDSIRSGLEWEIDSLPDFRYRGNTYPVKLYDDSYGPVYVQWETFGICGIVRARNESDAYSICEDEFFPEADETHEDFLKEYGEDYYDNSAWQESYGTRPNGGQVYQRDIHCDRMEKITPEIIIRNRLAIRAEIDSRDSFPGLECYELDKDFAPGEKPEPVPCINLDCAGYSKYVWNECHKCQAAFRER